MCVCFCWSKCATHQGSVLNKKKRTECFCHPNTKEWMLPNVTTLFRDQNEQILCRKTTTNILVIIIIIRRQFHMQTIKIYGKSNYENQNRFISKLWFWPWILLFCVLHWVKGKYCDRSKIGLGMISKAVLAGQLRVYSVSTPLITRKNEIFVWKISTWLLFTVLGAKVSLTKVRPLVFVILELFLSGDLFTWKKNPTKSRLVLKISERICHIFHSLCFFLSLK